MSKKKEVQYRKEFFYLICCIVCSPLPQFNQRIIVSLRVTAVINTPVASHFPIREVECLQDMLIICLSVFLY